MTTWFISDTHFGHANIIRYCSRPYSSVDQMDAALVANWNSRVAWDDEVYVVGDFAFGPLERVVSYLARLRGRKHLIRGNHDPDAVAHLQDWETSRDIAEIRVDGVRVVLCHYAMRVWPGIGKGGLMLYGHSHGALPGWRQSCDVGVDAGWGYAPVTLREIRRKLSGLSETAPG